jgi:hypothetical protein
MGKTGIESVINNLRKSMKENESGNQEVRDFNSISPSAKSLLLMKGFTNIPYAKRMAELVSLPANYVPDISAKDLTFCLRLVHFENRYWSIDELLSDLPIKNILELSSGFSCRGLEMVRKNDVYYIDTDLPDMIADKEKIIDLLKSEDPEMEGKLETLPLNALDEDCFRGIVDHFPPGEIVIINEGLLMYLNWEEKEKLCGIIHKILEERGGYWITADVYLKDTENRIGLKLDEKTKEFFEQQKINEKRFESFDEAKGLFETSGFEIVKEADVVKTKLSSIKFLLQKLPKEQLSGIQNKGKMQVTWCLKVKK